MDNPLSYEENTAILWIQAAAHVLAQRKYSLDDVLHLTVLAYGKAQTEPLPITPTMAIIPRPLCGGHHVHNN